LKKKLKTHADGAYTFQNSPGLATVLVRKAGQALAWQMLGQNFGMAPKPAAGVMLTPPGTLAGTVVDESNRPVASAEVLVNSAFIETANARGGWSFNYLNGELARKLFAARTDGAGHFRIKNFPTNAYAQFAVRVSGKVLRPAEGDASNSGPPGYRVSTKDIQLVLESAGSIEGKIICSQTNGPVPAARLILHPAQPSLFSGEVDPVRSDANGSFRFPAVAAGSYHIDARFGTNSPSDWIADLVPVSVESGQIARGLQVTAVRGELLEVSVQGEGDHKPVAGVNVTAYRESHASSGVSDDHGIARLRLLPGNYQVMAARESTPSAQTSVTVETGSTNRVELEIAAPKKIAGIVRAPDGRPAAGLRVLLVGGYGMNQDDIQTDAAGKFELDWNQRRFGGQNNGTSCLLIRDAEKNLAVEQDIDEDTGPLDLKLAPGLTLFGKAEADGKPITNATATLIFWHGNSGQWLQDLARTNTPGQYEIPALPPGRKYGVMVSAPGYGQKQLMNFEVNADPGRQELDPVELKVANLKLAGQVLDADDKPVGGCFVNLNGDDQPNGHVRTDHEGRFTFEHVCEGAAQLMANAQGSFGNISAEGGDTNVVLRMGQTQSYSSPGAQSHKLKGVVTDSDGKPDSGALLSVFPNNGGPNWTKAGADGSYSLTWSLQSWQLQNGGEAKLVVRDLDRNLATVEDLPEEATNLDVKLKPAVTLTGLVKNASDAPMPGAQMGFWFKAGNSFDFMDQQVKPANAEGHFEIKCLPADGTYIVFATAKGYGKSQQNVETEAETNVMELSPLVLKLADKVIAGQILKDDDKPASGVNINLNGEGQPDGNMTTDSKGRFHFKVCDGQIRLFAYSQYGGGNAQATVEAGDTNIVMNLMAQTGARRQARPHVSLKGSALPDVTTVNLAADAATAGKPVLLCLFDASQRPSRHVVHLLDQQAAVLGQKNVCLLGVQAAVTTDDNFNAWKTASPVSFPVGRVTEKSEKSRWAADAAAFPWLVLTDASHHVVAEGFSLDELDAQIQKLTK
jgi:hypothetical protein